MNRAILVVICDFVVLSMLSLTSLSPQEVGSLEGGGSGNNRTVLDNSTARTVLEQLKTQTEQLEAARQRLLKIRESEGTNAEREKELDKVSEELANARSQVKYLTKRLSLTVKELAEMTPEQLKELLDLESKNRELMMVRNEQLNSELGYVRQSFQTATEKLTDTSARLAAAVERVAATQEQLQQAKSGIQERDRLLGERDHSLQELGNTLAGTRQELAATGNQLQDTKTRLGAVGQELVKNREKLQTTETTLAYSQGQLEATVRELDSTSRDLAEARARLELEKRNTQSRELEINELKGQLNNTQTMLKRTVTDLNSAKSELQTRSTEAANTSAALADLQSQYSMTREQLQQAEAMLSSDVMKQYSESVSQMNFQLREKRMLLDYTVNRTFYLPEIQLDGRRFLISEVRRATGFDKADLGDNISALSYATSTPGAANDQAVLLDTLYLPAADRRVALFPTAGRSGKALRPITFPELVKRGTQELYLFKQYSFGTESCPLDTRVSLSLEPGDPYLYIRNSNRSSTELRAEPGDVILTKQGDFVGVVVSTEVFDMGSKEEAKCFVFPAAPALENAVVIPLNQADSSGFYKDFVQGVRSQLNGLRELDAVQRKR